MFLKINRFFISLGVCGTLSVCLSLKATPSAAVKPIPCKPPSGGPVWFQDFTPVQKQSVSAEWETENGRATYELSGKYLEAPTEKKNYKKWDSHTSLDLMEQWKCGSDGESEFVAISGEFETEAKWEVIGAQGMEEGKSEDKFLVRSLNEVRHLEHAKQTQMLIEQGGAKKTENFEEEWTQKWDSQGVARVQGEMETQTTFESSVPVKGQPGHENQTRLLASLGMGDFIEPQAMTLVWEKSTEKAQLDGPLEPKKIEREIETKVWKNEKSSSNLTLEKKTRSDEQREYRLNQKAFEFVLSTENRFETSSRPLTKEVLNKQAVEIWNNLEKPPIKQGYWEYKETASDEGRVHSYSIHSEGLEGLPNLFSKNLKNGTLKRFTEFDKNGRIKRFYVMYFPASKKGNEVWVDMNFSPLGFLSSFVVKDGNPEWAQVIQSPFSAGFMNPLRSVIRQVASNYKLDIPYKIEKHSPIEANFPKLLRKIEY